MKNLWHKVNAWLDKNTYWVCTVLAAIGLISAAFGQNWPAMLWAFSAMALAISGGIFRQSAERSAALCVEMSELLCKASEILTDSVKKNEVLADENIRWARDFEELSEITAMCTPTKEAQKRLDALKDRLKKEMEDNG